MKKTLIAGAVAALAVASQAEAAANLTYAAVKGTTGTIWYAGDPNFTANTTPTGNSSNYTLFLQQPTPGAYVNTGGDAAGNKGLNDPTAPGSNVFTIFGDAFQKGQTMPSDSTYNILLHFADGATISAQLINGVFTSGTSSTASAAGTTYTLTGFDWSRSGSLNSNDFVGETTVGPNGSGPDYTGSLSFTATAAVPEPATWAMMLVGFGMVGAVARRRRTATKVTYA